MTDRLSLQSRYRRMVEAILREHVPEAEVWAYGSRIQGRSHDGSDLDLVIRSPSLAPFGAELLDLIEAFKESNIPFLVQVHDWARLPESFHGEIELDYVVVQTGSTEDGGILTASIGQWRKMKLGDVATIIMGQSPPGSTVSDEVGVALLNGPTEFGPNHPTPVQFTTNPRKFAKPGDVLFCVRGSTTGRMNWADQEYAIGRGVAAIRHAYDPTLQPLLRGAIQVALPELLISATGSTFPNVSASQIADIPYPDLSPDEQRAIARVLGALDDKIELNRRMNETLEEMARALFKSWFVDFNPVRAKMEGRWRRGESLPGLPADLYDLFPDRLVDSELGEIPEGWGVGQFSNIATRLRDNENPAISAKTVFSLFSIPAYDEGQLPKRELGGSIKSTKSRVQQGTVLLSKLNPEIERVWLVDVKPDERAICSTEFFVLESRPPFQCGYVYCLARSPSFRQQMESFVTGTSKSHQRVPANALFSMDLVIPPNEVIEAFEAFASELLTRGKTLRRESHSLSAQRDGLLPKLVSGEVGVYSSVAGC